MFDTLFSDQAQGSLLTIAVLALVKLITVIFGDGNKRLDTKIAAKKLALAADEQESQQEERLAPVWRSILKDYEHRVENLERRLELFHKEHLLLSIQYAELKQNATFMESRVAELERQLEVSREKHRTDEQVISELEDHVLELNKEILGYRAKQVQLSRELSDSQILLEDSRKPYVSEPEQEV